MHVPVGRDLQDAHEVRVAEREEHVRGLEAQIVCRRCFLESSDGRAVAHVDERLCPLVNVLLLHSSAAMKKPAGNSYFKTKQKIF